MSHTRPPRHARRPVPGPARRRVNPLTALTAAAALFTGLLVAAHSAEQQAAARRAAESVPDVAPPVVAPSPSRPSGGTAPHGPTAPRTSAAGPAGAGAAAVGTATGPIALRYSFDDGPGHPMFATSGRYPLRIVTTAGGAITFVANGTGWAARFPRRCTGDPRTCPRAILQGDRVDALNPGTRPVRYGAAIRMTSTDTSAGANVVQKGFSVGGTTQFKLQVDGKAGRPSCVIASETRIYRVVATIGVADGRWHALACNRSGTRLGITVDGVARGTGTLPMLSIANSEPLRVGGKGTNPDNDQFAGQIDDVFVTIS